MAYEPLNLQNGQTLTAEDLQHMEQGIAGMLSQNPAESNVFIAHYISDNMMVQENWSEIVAAYNRGAAIFLQSDLVTSSDMAQAPVLRPLVDIDPSVNGNAVFAGLSYTSSEFAELSLRANFITIDSTGSGTLNTFVISTEN